MSENKKKSGYVTDSYSSFSCLGPDCPYTCCVGWEIIVDNETKERHFSEPGLKGLALKMFGGKRKDGLNCMKRDLSGRCLYHDRKRLCAFQRDGREDLMPEVCRVYPRILVDYGEYIEETLSLSCYKATLCALTTDEIPHLVPAKHQQKGRWKIGNKDENFLAFLSEVRQMQIDYIGSENSKDLWEKVKDIYDMNYCINFQLGRDMLEKAKEITLPPSEAVLKEIDVLSVGRRGLKFFYEISFMDKIINEILPKSETVRTFSYMSGLISRYNRNFEKRRPDEATRILEEKYDEMIEAHPWMEELLQKYYSYLILQNYNLAYEDYYVLGQALNVTFSLELITIFLVSEYISGREITLESVATIICRNEKITRHNMSFDQAILRRIREIWSN